MPISINGSNIFDSETQESLLRTDFFDMPDIGGTDKNQWNWSSFSYTSGTKYQNTFDYPIQAHINLGSTSNSLFSGNNSDGDYQQVGRGDGQQNHYCSTIVPPGGYWYASQSGTMYMLLRGNDSFQSSTQIS